MKAIILVHKDGSEQVAHVVPMNFDVQKWLDEKKDALWLLDVIRVEEHLYH